MNEAGWSAILEPRIRDGNENARRVYWRAIRLIAA